MNNGWHFRRLGSGWGGCSGFSVIIVSGSNNLWEAHVGRTPLWSTRLAEAHPPSSMFRHREPIAIVSQSFYGSSPTTNQLPFGDPSARGKSSVTNCPTLVRYRRHHISQTATKNRLPDTPSAIEMPRLLANYQELAHPSPATVGKNQANPLPPLPTVARIRIQTSSTKHAKDKYP